jgi:hypothetical protein
MDIDSAAVAELADALDSKSSGAHTPYRFDSDQRHKLYITKVLGNIKNFDISEICMN